MGRRSDAALLFLPFSLSNLYPSLVYPVYPLLLCLVPTPFSVSCSRFCVPTTFGFVPPLLRKSVTDRPTALSSQSLVLFQLV